MRINAKNLTVAFLTALAPVAAQAQDTEADRHELLPHSEIAGTCENHASFEDVNLCLARLQTFYSLVTPKLSNTAALFTEQPSSGQDVCETVPQSLAQATTKANEAAFNQVSLDDFKWDVSSAMLDISECLSKQAHAEGTNAGIYRRTAEMLADIAKSMTLQ